MQAALNMHWAFRPVGRDAFALKASTPNASSLSTLLPSPPPLFRGPFATLRSPPPSFNPAPGAVFPMPSPQQCFPLKGFWPHEPPAFPTFSPPGTKDHAPQQIKRKYRRRKSPPAGCTDQKQAPNPSSAKCASPDSTSAGSSSQKRIYSCTDCQYVTDRKNNLKRHVATMHESCTKLLECCDEVFANKALLREHVRRCHRHGYDCRVCGRTFCRKALLKRHVTVHSGQKDFVCGLCGYATSHKSNLDRHKRRHLPKHLRKPTFFPSAHDLPFAGPLHPTSASSTMLSEGKGPMPGSMAPPMSLMSAFYHPKPLRFGGTGTKLPSQGTVNRPRLPVHLRDSRMVKRKYSAFRKLMLLRCAARDSTQPNSFGGQQAADTQLNGGREGSDEDDSSDSRPEDEEEADERRAKGSVQRLMRLMPSLHRCKECDVVLPSQLALSCHLAEEHSEEQREASEPMRPLTLQMRRRSEGSRAEQAS